ncbi:Ferrichrome-iron receptor precursor [Lacunisphaera limnophila]|uniref:Ferrichrome-iron receptor n=1 Tax=Lacunisphaera limnophila TaxID=1838286 RepID=A0A1D8ARI5_9BACT|nr:TonB-dependent siderophore receptor [Lacunisphaera limnophila]AOS43511.1 Ferrichrome-iron receptor precursor [Lacunisphaera limnophila]
MHFRTFLTVSTLASATLLRAQTATATVELDKLEINAGKEAVFSLPLDSAPASGSRLGLANRDLPVSVSVITQEVMQLRGLRTAVEAVEAAVGMTGGTQFGSIPTYSTRGFGSNSVSVMRDGIRQNTASQSSRTVDSFLLDRVEVLKGPASLMFGEGAVGGAVNYLSKAPSPVARGEAFVSAGSWDSYRLGLGWGGPLPLGTKEHPVTARVDYSHNETAGYVDRNAQRYDAVAGALAWQATDRLKLSFNTTLLKDWNESYYGNPVVYDGVINTTIPGNTNVEVRTFNNATDRMVNPRVVAAARTTNYNILDNYAKTENTFSRLRAELRLTPDLELRNEAYVATQLLKWRNLETNTWNPVTKLVARSSFLHIYRDDVLAGNRLDLIHRGTIAGRPNRLIVGGFFERNDLTRGGTPFGLPTTASSVSLLNPAETSGPGDPDYFMKTSKVLIETAAFYVENALDLTNSVKLIAGLRHDSIDLRRDTLVTPANPTFARYRKSYSPLTGRAGVVWSATKAVNLYASYSRAAEPTTQLVSFTATSNDFALQTGRQFEVGAKGSLADGKVDFTLALFDIEKNNILASTLDPVTGLRVSQQIGAQNSRGVELAAGFSPADGWRLEGNVAWTDAWYGKFAENLGTGVISRTGNTPSNVPEWVASAFVVKRFPGGFALNGGVRYVSDRFANNNNSVIAEGYVTVDAGASYTWHDVTFTLRGRNLLDEEYQPVAGTTMWRLADPRNLELSARYTF